MSDKISSDFTGYNKNLKQASQKLRKGMTPQEKHLWYDFLKTYPVHFYRQRPIYKFIADFYCSKAKLVIEIDGSQHYSEDGFEYDKLRSEIINKYGVEVIRFSNYDIDNNFEGVCFTIDKTVRERTGEDMKFFK
jgi:very-short-patch-repair endonuclease